MVLIPPRLLNLIWSQIAGSCRCAGRIIWAGDKCPSWRGPLVARACWCRNRDSKRVDRRSRVARENRGDGDLWRPAVIGYPRAKGLRIAAIRATA